MSAVEAHLPWGTSARAPWALEVTPERAGWRYAGLRVLTLPPGGAVTFDTGDEEMLVLPLAGAATVHCDGLSLALAGRASVFAAVTDFAYLPRDATVTVRGEGRFALPSARATRRLSPRYGAARDVPVELRGAGPASRQINNFCSPEAFDCDRLVAVEVLTPGGNWSSYPPHKHEEERTHDDGRVEAELEEIYYFEVAGGVPGDPGGPVGYQRVYGTARRPIEVLAEVRGGDVVLVPYGYHGPSMAAPGYHLYYLNVLAGPGPTRSMACVDDPRHHWVRGSWTDQPVDPRLPLTGPTTREA
ncbi:5-deoxy-glucuronate isomerase [Micromonospora purpureochromogenes]|uniref:5-deoxy-glucuronate isomerase n=1 Tax=Micromonospora purpureochromogenes TaxID=47872 RepID=A0A1C4YHM3_9ACTN|nr:5-deoxy-glucuronate isomerase [Micromonospora purpureochromogenes]SCF20223.1 5-deoxy-glucuronate isomerase [Micromonospora purpureochromogenes]